MLNPVEPDVMLAISVPSNAATADSRISRDLCRNARKFKVLRTLSREVVDGVFNKVC
jgi:hypothetical protein